MSGQRFEMKHKYDSYQKIGIQYPPARPFYILVQSYQGAAQLFLFYRGLSLENKILDGMTRGIIWDREN